MPTPTIWQLAEAMQPLLNGIYNDDPGALQQGLIMMARVTGEDPPTPEELDFLTTEARQEYCALMRAIFEQFRVR